MRIGHGEGSMKTGLPPFDNGNHNLVDNKQINAISLSKVNSSRNVLQNTATKYTPLNSGNIIQKTSVQNSKSELRETTSASTKRVVVPGKDKLNVSKAANNINKFTGDSTGGRPNAGQAAKQPPNTNKGKSCFDLAAPYLGRYCVVVTEFLFDILL